MAIKYCYDDGMKQQNNDDQNPKSQNEVAYDEQSTSQKKEIFL